ncbi:centromere protein W [Thalassophryne amazonica]|uniref:centromere protein W n=1 Tax=Thalassophryne amazonica TaxID=390379 RepID=UPI0014720362|nr:centromere protein W [Thalassophryne amazonica]
MINKAPKLRYVIKRKTTSDVNVAAASEAMVELAAVLFLNSLAEEARGKAFEEKTAIIKAHHVRAVGKKMLKKARG